MRSGRLATVLSCLTATGSLAACGSGLVETDVRLALSHSGRSTHALTGTSALSGCDAAEALCTPMNLAGRIFSGGAMWGELGPEAFNVTMLGANADVIQNPSEGLGGVLEFSLIEATTLAGQYSSPGSGSEPKRVRRMELSFDYLDATIHFELPGSSLDGDWVVRTVFVTTATAADVAGVMQRGDKLVRRSDEASFRYCSSSACAPDRASVANGIIQEAKLVSYVHPGPGHGNPAYIPFAVPVRNELMLTGDQLEQPDGTWSAAFDMTGAVRFRALPRDLSSESELLSAFELSYDPDQAHAGDLTQISVDLQLLH